MAEKPRVAFEPRRPAAAPTPAVALGALLAADPKRRVKESTLEDLEREVEAKRSKSLSGGWGVLMEGRREEGGAA
jgi:hypothetical protein